MNSKQGLILLFTDKPDNWVISLLSDVYEFSVTSDLQNAVKALQYVRYDVILLDDRLFGDQLLKVVNEIKRRFPILPLIILSDNPEQSYYSILLNAGVDDVLSPNLTVEELHFHIRVVLEQHQRNRALVQRNQNLHTIASLPRLLEGIHDLQPVIVQSIKIISNMLRLNGVVVVLTDHRHYRLYAGSSSSINQNQLFEGEFQPGDFDPFLWTMKNKSIQVYNDIQENPYYMPIPTLESPRSAVILPLMQNTEQIGAVGIFPTNDTIVSDDDVFIYEQYCRQLSSVLRNVSQHQAQNLLIRMNERLLAAWGDFSGIQNPFNVAALLCAKISEVLSNYRVAVWFDSADIIELQHVWFDNFDGQIVDLLKTVDGQEVVESIQMHVSGSLQPLMLDERTVQQPMVQAMFPVLRARQIMILPVLSNSDLMVRAFVGVDDDYLPDMSEINLIENIAQIAAHTLERFRLSNALLENHGRLMSILCSINEGIFFVDEGDQVVFCNPQVKEMLEVPVSEFINHDADLLLRAIAANAQSPTQIYEQLLAAKKSVLEDNTEKEYPIVDVTLEKDGSTLQVEFSKVFGQDETISWIGVIHVNLNAKHSLMIDSLLEKIRLPYTQVRSQIATLAEQHGHFGYRERDKLLAQIEQSINRMGREWDHFVDLYKLQSGGITLHREPASLQMLIETLLESRQFSRYARFIQVELPPTLPTVKIDEFNFKRAIANLLERGLGELPPNKPLTLRVENRVREVRIHFDGAGSFIPPEKLEHALSQLDYLPDVDAGFVDVYVASEIIRRNGGRVWADNGVVISLPVATSPETAPEPEPKAAPIVPQNANRAPSRELNAVLLLQGKSALSERLYRKLNAEDYEVLLYKASDEAVRDLDATHLDLIVIDVNLSDGNGIKVCKQVRQHTETPILLLADNASAQDKVQGLNAGADEFIAGQITEDELIARVRVIINRRFIPERLSEPLVIDDLYIDFARRAVFLSNNPLELTRIEYDLLYTLVMNRGQTVTHKQLLTQVWGPEYQDEIQYLWVNISRLRKKLEPTSDSPRYIRTQPGIGYYFEAP